MKLNLGCGKDIKEGWINVDSIAFDESVIVCDLGNDIWPWDDDSIEEAFCSHMVEHLKPKERAHFINELYRVLIPERGCQIIVPHAMSERAYGDLTHQWPPVVSFWFFYLDKDWRAVNAPHNNYDLYNEDVDFGSTWSYVLRQDLCTRNLEYQQYAIANFKEAITDLIATIVKKPKKGE